MGQVSAAYDALESIGLANLVAVGIAKREELLVLRDRPEPVVLDRTDPALLLVQRIRDEAHRFAVTFHRKARSMRDLRSELDDVPGIGPRRRRALLTHFGSLAGVRRATREELTPVVGAKVARAVLEYFAQSGDARTWPPGDPLVRCRFRSRERSGNHEWSRACARPAGCTWVT